MCAASIPVKLAPITMAVRNGDESVLESGMSLLSAVNSPRKRNDASDGSGAQAADGAAALIAERIVDPPRPSPSMIARAAQLPFEISTSASE
jgi:hypothetical protein